MAGPAVPGVCLCQVIPHRCSMRPSRTVPLFDVLKRGYDALLASDYRTVVKVLDSVLRQHPNEPNALLLAAMFGAERGRRTCPDGQVVDGLEKAQEWIERGIEKADAPWPLAWNFKSTLF